MSCVSMSVNLQYFPATVMQHPTSEQGDRAYGKTGCSLIIRSILERQMYVIIKYTGVFTAGTVTL